jgi:hypothetical protein
MKITKHKSEISNKSQLPKSQISNGCRLSFVLIGNYGLVLVCDLLPVIWNLLGPLLLDQRSSTPPTEKPREQQSRAGGDKGGE